REIEQPAVDARFAWNGGNLRVIRESQEGRGLDPDNVMEQIRDHVFSRDRVIELALTVSPPRVGSGDGPNLGIKEMIRQGKTAFAGSVPEKQENIALAASRL